MKILLFLVFLMFSVSAISAEWTQQQVNEYNVCSPILKELKWLKAMRAQNMETGGGKSLAEIEKDWQSKSSHFGCYVWQNEYDRRNP